MSDGMALEALQRRSFDLHVQLAQELDGAQSWNFRHVDAFSIDLDGCPAFPSAQEAAQRPSWLREGVMMQRCRSATAGTAAQVHPKKFCEAMASAAELAGVRKLLGVAGRVTAISACNGSVSSVTTADSAVHPCATIVVAAGPWSAHIMRLCNLREESIEMFPLRGRLSHSVVVSPLREEVVEPLALFIDDRSLGQEGADPDLYVRHNEVYLSGEAVLRVAIPPGGAAEVAGLQEPACFERLLQTAARVSPALDSLGDCPSARVVHRDACFTPHVGTEDDWEADPLIGVR
jgi:glycine/D-amino acid oxidase-like deaminating enzyme